MKSKINLVFFLIFLLPFVVPAQDKFRKGFIVTNDGEKLEGSIRQLFGSTGGLLFLSTKNKRETFAPANLKSFEIDSIRYISYLNDFYEEVFSGQRATLYRKVTDNSDQLIYNESQPVRFVQTTEGRKGDYFVLCSEEARLDLVTRRNFKSYFLGLMNIKASLSEQIENGILSYEQIRRVVELINE